MKKIVKISVILLISYIVIFVGTSYNFKNAKVSLDEKPPVVEEPARTNWIF